MNADTAEQTLLDQLGLAAKTLLKARKYKPAAAPIPAATAGGASQRAAAAGRQAAVQAMAAQVKSAE